MTSFHFLWVGGPGNWNDASHWTSNGSPNPLPFVEDTVSIPASAGMVTVPALSAAGCKSAVIDADFRLLAGTVLGLFGSSLTINGTMTLDGGGLIEVRFNNSGTVDGTGTVTFANGGGGVGVVSSLATLTLGPALTIRNGTTRGRIFGGTIVSRATLIVEGSDSSGLQCDWNKTFTNRGTIHLNSSALRLSSGSNGTWTSVGQININGGALFLGGVYRQSDLGSYTRAGGTITAVGTLNGNLTLDAHSGSWIGSGTLVGGRLTTRDGTTFNATNCTFDNYTLGSDLTVSGSVVMKNTLTLDGTTLKLENAELRLGSPFNTIGGSGQILLNSTTFSGEASFTMFTGGAQVTTIERGVTIRTGTGNGTFSSGNTNSRLVLKGPLGATTTSKTINLNVSNIDLFGQITVGSGANLRLSGTLNIQPAGSLVTGGTGQLLVSKSINNNATNPGRGRSGGIAQYIGGTSVAPLTIEMAGEDRGRSQMVIATTSRSGYCN
jgi:hypothetical protein